MATRQELLFKCLVLVICYKSIRAQCTNGWTVYEDSCYIFSHEIVHFVEAENFCRQHGGHLVHIETAAENNFLKSFATDLKDASHWIGLTDQTIEGEWRWYDTDTLATFTDWYPGQPNDGRAGDCAVLAKGVNYTWADRPCSTLNYQPLCERKQDTEAIVG